MLGSECTHARLQDSGCATHGWPECVCDVPVVDVAVSHVPNAARLLELGRGRSAFLTWAAELLESVDRAPEPLRLVAEG